MCSIVCQGLQSCQEVVESRFLRLKLVPPQTSFTDPCNPETNTAIITTNKNDSNDGELIANRNANMAGWSFLQSLSDAKAPTEGDNVYVHPLVKCSAFRLSEKSLEMCTERLGSETGSEGSDCRDDISLLWLETQTVACDVMASKLRESSSIRKTSRSISFPPPLTSIRGSNGVKVRSCRENGRLVLEAVSFRPCHSYFHAERSEGRLRLSLFKDANLVLGDDEDDDEGVEVEVEVEEEEFYGETENQEGNNGNDGNLQRPSSCTESVRGHKGGLLNWKPFLVAT